jgi:thiosulfate/3-mercaptopyruvate sulfurtransferase
MRQVTITAHECAALLRTPDDVVVLDGSVLRADGEVWSTVPGYDNFLAGHLPGAQFADIENVFSDPSAQQGLPNGLRAFGLPTVAQFEAAARQHGISNTTTVVAYDTVQGQWASRIWWLFTYFGHDQVRVLDGGLAAWQTAGLPVETGTPQTPSYGTFVAQVRPHMLATTEDVKAAVAGERDDVVMNVLPPAVFRGEIDSDMPRKGRIPHSINVPYTTLLTDDATFKPEHELRDVFAASGVDGTRPVITYCGAGIGATRNALALYELGFDVAVYDGSLIAWTSDPTVEVHTGEPA